MGSNISIPLTNWNVCLNGEDRQVQDSVSGEVISLTHGLYLQYSAGDTALIPFLKGVTTTLGSLIDTLVEMNYPSLNGVTIGTNILNDIINNIVNLAVTQSGIQIYYDWQSITSTLTIYHNLNNFQVDSTFLTGFFELDCTFQISSSSFSTDYSVTVPSLNLGGLASIIEDGAGLVVKQAGQIILTMEKLGADLTVFTKKAYQDFANAVKAGVKVCNSLVNDAKALANGIMACGVQVSEVIRQCTITAPPFPSFDSLNLLNVIGVFESVPQTVDNLIGEINHCINDVAGQVASSISDIASCSMTATNCQNSLCVPFVGYGTSSCCCGISFFHICLTYSRYCCALQWINCEWSICLDNSFSFHCNGVPVACP